MPGLIARALQRFGGETRRNIGPMVGFGLGPIMSASRVNVRMAENIATVVA